MQPFFRLYNYWYGPTIWSFVAATMRLLFVVIYKASLNQRGNQNPHIEEEQTTQWSKEKIQKDKRRSTKHKYKTKDRV